MSYAASVLDVARDARLRLDASGVDVSALEFGGPTALPQRISPPTFADTKFQMEQAFGDWAEAGLKDAINRASNSLRAIHYGDSSKLVAGEVGFADAYKAGVQATAQNGKRPDLLVVDSAMDVDDDISNLDHATSFDYASRAEFAVEVRSSRLEMDRYVKYQQTKHKPGTKDHSKVPSFTVKVEDLMKVYRWIEVHRVQQLYAQVLLDHIFAIDVLNIFRHIADIERPISITKHKRSVKTTIMIPVTSGTAVGRLVQYPTFEVVDRVTANGRHDIFAVPIGGKHQVDIEDLQAALSTQV